MKHAIISTSSSGLANLKFSHHMHILPMHVKINNVDFLDSKNINPAKLTQIMQTSPNSLAKTSPPSEAEIMQMFESLYNEGYQSLFVCTLSSKFSETYNMVQACRKRFDGKMNIFVYDTLNLNLTEATMSYEADSWFKQEKSFAEITRRLDYIRDHSSFLFTLSDLTYITKAGKLSAPASFFANLFDIKPIMEIDKKGFIVAKEKVRKLDNTLRRMAEITLETAGNDAYIYLSDGGHDFLTTYYARLLYREYGLKDLPVFPVSTISLANHGYKCIGIGSFYGDLPEIVQRLKT